jgi:hypothetical protein
LRGKRKWHIRFNDTHKAPPATFPFRLRQISNSRKHPKTSTVPAIATSFPQRRGCAARTRPKSPDSKRLASECPVFGPPAGDDTAPAKPVRVSSRGKLSAEFIEALAADFETHGPDVIARVRQENPSQYAKICADLLPKQVEVDVAPFAAIQSFEELKPFYIDAIFETPGWLDAVLERAGVKTIEAKALAIEVSENAHQ